MQFARTSLCTTTLAMALLAAPPQAALAQNALIDGLTLRTLSRLSTQYMLLAARAAVDLTYEHLTIDAHTGDTIISGLRLYPRLDWDGDGACKIEVDRISSAASLDFDGVRQRMEMTGVNIAPSCFEPEAAGMMTAFGYDGVTVDNVSMDTAFQFGSSAADVTLHAAVKDAAVVNATAAFDYLWLTGVIPEPDNPSGEPYPVALLRQAEIAIDNKGLFERLEPMLAGQLGDINEAPAMIQAVLMEALSDSVNPPGEREITFVNNAAEEVGRFVQDKDRLVIAVAPPEGVWLEEEVFQSPATAIAALNPAISRAPLISRALIGASELATAISGDVSTLDEGMRLRVGEALLTGIGAPRSILHGRALLEPLAEGWSPAAALLLAEALSTDGEGEQAYAMALRAATGGESRGMTVADRLEESMGARAVLSVQAEASADWPGSEARVAADQEILNGADVAAMRERAHAAALGRGVPRSYADAYFWASLAAAAGDRSSAGLRVRLDKRFAKAEGEDRDAWRGVALASAEAAITTWTEGGLGARIAALYGVGD